MSDARQCRLSRRTLILIATFLPAAAGCYSLASRQAALEAREIGGELRSLPAEPDEPGGTRQGWVFEPGYIAVYRFYGGNGHLWWECPVLKHTVDRVFTVVGEEYDAVARKVINTYWQGHPGVRHGVVKAWYPDGVLRYERPFVRDMREGLSWEYYENGRLKRIEFHTAGLETFHRSYDRDGKMSSGMCKNDWKLPAAIEEKLEAEGYRKE